MKAFVQAVVLIAAITVGAAASVGLLQTSAQDAYTNHSNVRL